MWPDTVLKPVRNQVDFSRAEQGREREGERERIIGELWAGQSSDLHVCKQIVSKRDDFFVPSP